MILKYSIDNKILDCAIDPSIKFSKGNDLCLSSEFDDLTATKDWHESGFTLINTDNILDKNKVYLAIKNKIYSLVNPDVKFNEFRLEDYHKYVDDNLHNEVINTTKKISPEDLNFDSKKLIDFLSIYFMKNLDWKSNGLYEPKIIVRIVMPNSLNFNPAHKDIYQIYDKTKFIPRMVNVWIPVCGVNHNSGLPIAEGSHLLKESVILRTFAGTKVNGISYNVNCIKSWDNNNKLTTISPKNNEMIIFSSFLIHGLAKNYSKDTRVSLEFRLFEKVNN